MAQYMGLDHNKGRDGTKGNSPGDRPRPCAQLRRRWLLVHRAVTQAPLCMHSCAPANSVDRVPGISTDVPRPGSLPPLRQQGPDAPAPPPALPPARNAMGSAEAFAYRQYANMKQGILQLYNERSVPAVFACSPKEGMLSMQQVRGRLQSVQYHPCSVVTATPRRSTAFQPS